jgi:hypothetical protein
VSALREVAGGIDKPGDFIKTQHRRQPDSANYESVGVQIQSTWA